MMVVMYRIFDARRAQLDSSECVRLVGSLIFKKFDSEDQGAVRWNWSYTSCTIPKLRRYNNLTFFSYIHACNCHIKTWNHLTSTKNKVERLSPGFTGVKDLSIGNSSGIMNSHSSTIWCWWQGSWLYDSFLNVHLFICTTSTFKVDLLVLSIGHRTICCT